MTKLNKWKSILRNKICKICFKNHQIFKKTDEIFLNKFLRFFLFIGQAWDSWCDVFLGRTFHFTRYFLLVFNGCFGHWFYGTLQASRALIKLPFILLNEEDFWSVSRLLVLVLDYNLLFDICLQELLMSILCGNISVFCFRCFYRHFIEISFFNSRKIGICISQLESNISCNVKQLSSFTYTIREFSQFFASIKRNLNWNLK